MTTDDQIPNLTFHRQDCKNPFDIALEAVKAARDAETPSMRFDCETEQEFSAANSIVQTAYLYMNNQLADELKDAEEQLGQLHDGKIQLHVLANKTLEYNELIQRIEGLKQMTFSMLKDSLEGLPDSSRPQEKIIEIAHEDQTFQLLMSKMLSRLSDLYAPEGLAPVEFAPETETSDVAVVKISSHAVQAIVRGMAGAMDMVDVILGQSNRQV